MTELLEENRFKGYSENSVDEKGRVFVPVKMRELLGPRFTVSKGLDRCIEIHSEIGWQNKIAEIAGKKGNSVINLKRYIGASSEDVTFDKQGRIIIPAYLREYAGIGREVVFVGVLTHAEIWDKQEWLRVCAEEATPDVARKEMDHMYGDDVKAE